MKFNYHTALNTQFHISNQNQVQYPEYHELAAMIVYQTIIDYRNLVVKKVDDMYVWKSNLFVSRREIEKFFYGPLFRFIYPNLDPEKVIEYCKDVSQPVPHFEARRTKGEENERSEFNRFGEEKRRT